MATAEGLSKTTQINGMRYYDVGLDQLFPSVTTILGKMTDQSGLDHWRNKIGKDKANKITKFSANRGTIMHQMIEYFLLSNKKNKSDRLKESQLKILEFVKVEGYTEEELNIGRKLFYNFYNANSFDQISKIVEIEKTLHSTRGGGYAGRVDTIYEKNDGRLIISDYKSSRKPKQLNWIENYFIQTSAYFIAYWEMTGIKPADCEIWISNEQNDTPQIFHMGLPAIKVYSAKFLNMVKGFHNKYKH
tara:strand:- start:1083 stop:1820 length:738 start_codon:yes stop_codon:yes gene_type:complete